MTREAWRQQIAEQMSQCALANLRRASRAITRLYDDALAPSGLRSTQFTLLATVAASEVLTVTELAHALGMDRTTLARNLGPLERDHLVQVDAGADQRVRLVSLTDAGLERLRTAIPLRSAAQRRVVGTLGADTFRQLLGALDAIGATIKS
jgi:DNA-binding MarR family transcriptional regulator